MQRKNARKLPRFVGVRLEAGTERKLLELSRAAGKPGNMSAGLRWALDKVEARQTPPEMHNRAGEVLEDPGAVAA